MTQADDVALDAETGRPDTAELSRVIARAIVERGGGDLGEFGPARMDVTGAHSRTPRSAAELVPGDIASVRAAAAGLTVAAQSADASVRRLAELSAAAHARLAEALTRLRGRADEIYSASAELGTGDDLVSGSPALRDFIAGNPQLADSAKDLGRRAIELRLRWNDAQIDFIDDLAEVRRTLEIPDW